MSKGSRVKEGRDEDSGPSKDLGLNVLDQDFRS